MEEKQQSVWQKDLNLVFVYAVIFLFGVLTVYIMTNILNNKVEEINNSIYNQTEYNKN